MHRISQNIELDALNLLRKGVAAERIVILSDHPEYEGYLHVEPLAAKARTAFLINYSDWMSRLMILNGLHLLDRFIEKIEEDGYHYLFTPSTEEILTNHERWSAPLTIGEYTLRPFQQFCMNQALERARTGESASDRFYFWNWSAGAGKSFCSGAGAKALKDSGDVDLILMFTLNDLLKTNVLRDWTNNAGLSMAINDGVPKKRHQRYLEPADGFIMNYEKLRIDEEPITELVAGKRVLFVLDEGHKLIGESGQNKARKALDRITRKCVSTVWPMSATVVGGNPLRFRDVFSLDGYSRNNPLGTKEDFCIRYADEIKHIPIRTNNGGMFTLTVYDWNLPLLHEVRHRVGDRTMAVRKTDPGIREQFKGIECLPEYVPMTDELSEIYSLILDDARKARDLGESREQHYLAMRLASINPAVFRNSASEVSQRIWQNHRHLCVPKASNKIVMLNDRLESLREAQDKAVVFCHWAELGVVPLQPLIKVPNVIHWGGMSTDAKVAAQDTFKQDTDITCFLSSDAGTHGLNMQVARYVISVDPLYSYDDLTQRNSRIDRADSHLDGLTAYVMITEDSTVENRIWNVCDSRRRLAEATQGTQEHLTYSTSEDQPESNSIDWLIGLEN